MQPASVGNLLSGCLVFLLLAATSVAAQDDDEAQRRIDLCIISYLPEADFRTLRVEADQEKSAEEMAALLDAVDVDDDREITADEVREYEEGSDRTQDANEDLKMDGRFPSSARYRTVLFNFEGPIDEERPRLVTEHRLYTFETEPADEHRLEGGLYGPRDRVVIEFVVIEAPQSWLVHAVNQKAYDQQRVEIESFDTQSYFTIDFARETDDPSALPAPAPLLVLLVALAFAAHLRRQNS